MRSQLRWALGGSGAAAAGVVAAQHRQGRPTIHLPSGPLGAAAIELPVAEVVAEPVREHFDAALAVAPDDDLVDAAACHRPLVAGPEPQLRPAGLGMPGADPDLPVRARAAS
jgi:hypothetical protein